MGTGRARQRVRSPFAPMLLSITVYLVVGALYAQGLVRVGQLLFGPLLRKPPHVETRDDRCPACPEGWA